MIQTEKKSKKEKKEKKKHLLYWVLAHSAAHCLFLAKGGPVTPVTFKGCSVDQHYMASERERSILSSLFTAEVSLNAPGWFLRGRRGTGVGGETLTGPDLSFLRTGNAQPPPTPSLPTNTVPK